MFRRIRPVFLTIRDMRATKNKIMTMIKNDKLIIAGESFSSRLILGTGKYSSVEKMNESVTASGAEIVTIAMKRVESDDEANDLLKQINKTGVRLLPNTSGARNAEEAILAAQLSREAFQTNWIKLEIHPDPRHLLPDTFETIRATEELVKQGFVVLPYITPDPVACRRLQESGAAAVMPLAAPIGSNLGITDEEFISLIIEQSTVPVVIDAGLGVPSHAARAMELGADAVMVNTAIATAGDPVAMAEAFAGAIEAGRKAYNVGVPVAGARVEAEATSPLTAFLND